jgi:hypothetical protein
VSDKPRLPHQFQPGNSGGPGRPKGARHKLKELFVAALANDFEEHGIEAIKSARTEKPDTYLKVIASILPKEHTGEDGAPLFEGLQISFVKGKKE